MAKINNYILVCGGTGCRASRSEEIIAALRRALDRTGESERTRVISQRPEGAWCGLPVADRTGVR